MSEYKLLSEDTVKKLNASVAAHLKDGWQVHGSPFAFGMHNQPAMLLQAVVKWPEPDKWPVEIIEQLKVPESLQEPPYKYGYDA